MMMTNNELAVIDAQIEASGYNVTYQMIDLVTAYIVVRCMRAYSYSGAPNVISDLTETIAEYFNISRGLAWAIQDAIFSNPPEMLRSVTMSMEWRGKVIYENPYY
jgi:hypothetical protein